MIVAVVDMGVMQVTANQVVGVVTVGNGFVAAAGTVAVRCVVTATFVTRRAAVGVGQTDSQSVLINVVAVHMMKVPIVDVIHVTVMDDRGVATTRSVLVGVPGMGYTGSGTGSGGLGSRHGFNSSVGGTGKHSRKRTGSLTA